MFLVMEGNKEQETGPVPAGFSAECLEALRQHRATRSIPRGDTLYGGVSAEEKRGEDVIKVLVELDIIRSYHPGF